MHSMTRQKGMTGIGWLIVLALIGFFVLLVLKMFPEYKQYFDVASTLNSMEKESGFSSPADIRKMAERRFDVSFITAITPRDLVIRPKGDKYTVQAKYERKVHLFYNVSVVMDFDKQVTVDRK